MFQSMICASSVKDSDYSRRIPTEAITPAKEKLSSLMRRYGSAQKSLSNSASKHNYTAAKAALARQQRLPKPESPLGKTVARVKSKSFANSFHSPDAKPETQALLNRLRELEELESPYSPTY